MSEKEGISGIPKEGETFTLLAGGYEAFKRYNRDLSPN